jgi:hypothetical protein
MGAFKRMSGGKRPKRLELVTDAASMHANAYEMRQAAYGGIIRIKLSYRLYDT